MLELRAIVIGLGLLILTACGSAPSPVDAAPAEADLVFVFLREGPKSELAPGDLQELIDAHVAYRRRLIAAGDLLLAGTFSPPRADPLDRGFLILDMTDLAHAEQIAQADPAVFAGVFRTEVMPWYGSSSLREVARREREFMRSISPDAGVESTLRGYVLASTAASDAAQDQIDALRARHKVAFTGRFGGAREGELTVALIAQDGAEAAGLLGADSAAWTLRPWLDTVVLQDL